MNKINPTENYKINVISSDPQNISRPISNSPIKNVRFVHNNNPTFVNPINRSQSINIVGPPPGYIVNQTIPVVTQRTILPHPTQIQYKPINTIHTINNLPLNYNLKRSYTAEQLGLSRSKSINNLSGVVSRYQYEKSLNDLKILQVRYNQLNMKYLSLLNGGGKSTSSEQVRRLRQQNFELQQRVVNYQTSEKILHENIQKYIGQLVNKYRDSTLKETTLLLDRFKLQTKQIQKENTRYKY